MNAHMDSHNSIPSGNAHCLLHKGSVRSAVGNVKMGRYDPIWKDCKEPPYLTVLLSEGEKWGVTWETRLGQAKEDPYPGPRHWDTGAHNRMWR